jgi:hypothetical protein
MDINDWLDKFKEYWQNHNIKGILSLFDKRIIYYETPSVRLSFNELAKEWESIKEQEKISLNFKVTSSQLEKHTVNWKLNYLNENKNDILSTLKGGVSMMSFLV